MEFENLCLFCTTGTVPVWTSLVASDFVRKRAALAARSAWTKSVQLRVKAGPATAKSLQLPYPRVLASLTALAHLLLDHPIKILCVHTANHLTSRSPVKTMDAPKSGMGWVPVSMHPAQTGQTWMPTSTSVFLEFLANVVLSPVVSAFRRRSSVLTKDAPNSLMDSVFV